MNLHQRGVSLPVQRVDEYSESVLSGPIRSHSCGKGWRDRVLSFHKKSDDAVSSLYCSHYMSRVTDHVLTSSHRQSVGGEGGINIVVTRNRDPPRTF